MRMRDFASNQEIRSATLKAAGQKAHRGAHRESLPEYRGHGPPKVEQSAEAQTLQLLTLASHL